MARKNTHSQVVQLKPALTKQRLKISIEDLPYLNPLTHNQAKFFNLYNKGCEFIILNGYPGTGKSFISLYKALEEVLDRNTKINKIVIIRSAVETRSLGALPGTIDEKIGVYEQPYIDICSKIFDKHDAYTRLKEQKYVEFHPTSFLRSMTFDNSMILLDECFPPETEILTEAGFVKFEELSKETKVAQVLDNNDIEFVSPLRYINKFYQGKMVELNQNRISLTTTANHDLVYIDNNNKEYKQKAIDKTFNHHFLKTSVNRSYDGVLDDKDVNEIIYMCAIQAGGSYLKTIKTNNEPHYHWVITFRHQDKIERFRNCILKLGIEYSEYEKDKKGRVRFYISKYNPIGFSDFKSKTFDVNFILNKPPIWHEKFIKETFLWNCNIKTETPLYCSSNFENISLLQILGHLHGYRCSIMTTHNARIGTYKTYYRLTFAKTNKISLQNSFKKIYDYEGNVYCVEVPSGKIMIRQNGSVFVTGNCQNLNFQELDTVITRIGNNTKLIMCGDYNQTDLSKSGKDSSGLLQFFEIAKRMPSVKMINFDQDEDIVRGKLVKEYIIAKYKK